MGSLRAVGIGNLGVNNNLRNTALVSTVVNLYLALLRKELNRRWARAAVVLVKASAVKKVAFANRVALTLLPCL